MQLVDSCLNDVEYNFFSMSDVIQKNTRRQKNLGCQNNEVNVLEGKSDSENKILYIHISSCPRSIICCLNFTESEKSQLFATKCQIFVKSLRRKHQQDFLNWNVCLFVNCISKKEIENPDKNFYKIFSVLAKL